MTHSSDPFLLWLREAFDAQKTGRLNDAEQLYRQVIDRAPHHVMAHHLLGILLNNSGRPDEALGHLRLCTDLSPQDPVAHNNLANTLKLLGRHADSIHACNTALALRPQYVIAFCSRANAHAALGEFSLALNDFDQALALQPSNAEAWTGQASLLIDNNNPEQGLESARKALALRTRNPDALVCAGIALIQLKRSAEAIPLLRDAVELSPHHKTAWGWLVHAKMSICDWSDFDAHVDRLVAELVNHGAKVPPLLLMTCLDAPALHAAAVKQKTDPNRSEQITQVTYAPSGKIRLAYISGDFRDHPVGLHTAPLFENHDRSQFHVIGISVGPDDASPLRNRIQTSFDEFFDVNHETDQGIFNLMVSKKIDIVVDMMGLTQYARPGVFKEKPAPIVINYLAFPGTLNNLVHDYVLADKNIIPSHFQKNYTEKILYLAHNYLPIDEKWPKVNFKGDRTAENLPENYFVFASFNSINKITPFIFDTWMQILNEVPLSVLWLQGSDAVAMSNLLQIAVRHGIDTERIIFAKRREFETHLQRHALADLFLDTFPYNAHSTAGFALWAGLPVLTLQGESFASRVAASMLHSVGLSELISTEIENYKCKAIELAINSRQLFSMKEYLINNRLEFDWFNSKSFTADLEINLKKIYNHWLHGGSAQNFN